MSAGHTSVFALDENGKWLLIARGHLGRGFPEHPDEMRPDPCPPRPQHKTFLSPMRAASLRSAFPQAPLPLESCRVGSTSPPQVLRPACASGREHGATAQEHLLDGATRAWDSEVTCPAWATPAPQPQATSERFRPRPFLACRCHS